MKAIINTEKYSVVYNWLCDNVGKEYGRNSWMHIGNGWSIRRITNHISVWEVRVDFRRIPASTRTEFLLRFV